MPERAVHQFSPFDTRAAVRRFLDNWSPDLGVWVESELWPRLLVETDRRGIPMLLINARVSDRTAARWPRTAPFRAILVQEEQSASVIRDIGVPAGRLTVTGSMKESLPPLEADPAAMQAALDARPSATETALAAIRGQLGRESHGHRWPSAPAAGPGPVAEPDRSG